MYVKPGFQSEVIYSFAEDLDGLSQELNTISPSEWAEERRYLPPSVTTQPGHYSFDVTPYWREPLDCLSPQSPIRIVDIMKGVQTGYTVGIIENGIGYAIDHLRSDPCMLITADAELAKLRLDTYILPMLEASGLSNLIRSSEEDNPRKTGKTSQKVSWQGGGFCVFFGAKNPDKMRSTSIKILWEDETDTFPAYDEKDGRSGSLAEDRTANYEETRKIIRGSTPLITQTSTILRGFQSGDRRYYNVPCGHCGAFQWLRFTGTNEKGQKYGLTWDMDGERLVEGSVEYICRYCGAAWKNDDKSHMLPAGIWIPTATPDRKAHRSYQLSALYSPVGFQSWEEQVQKWLLAWDISANRPRDMAALQQFYNNVLGEPFEMVGESLKLETVQAHRRLYHIGTVPNNLAVEEAGGPCQVVTAAVDIHKRHVDYQVVAWAPGGRWYSTEYAKLECTDGEDRRDPIWGKIEEIIEKRVYKGDDGRIYRPQMTLIDAGYATNAVYDFCGQYETGVYAIMGRDLPPKSATFKEFAQYESKMGTRCFNVTTGFYKDRLAAALKREWSGIGLQPLNHPNFPQEYPDKFFKELRAESKQEIKYRRTRITRCFLWTCPSNMDNHAWDLSVYNLAALDMIALDICARELGLDHVDWPAFWEVCERDRLFWD